MCKKNSVPGLYARTGPKRMWTPSHFNRLKHRFSQASMPFKSALMTSGWRVTSKRYTRPKAYLWYSLLAADSWFTIIRFNNRQWWKAAIFTTNESIESDTNKSLQKVCFLLSSHPKESRTLFAQFLFSHDMTQMQRNFWIFPFTFEFVEKGTDCTRSSQNPSHDTDYRRTFVHVCVNDKLCIFCSPNVCTTFF